MVDWTPVESSNVEKVGYDIDNEELFIKFKGSEKVFRYQKVPPAVFKELLEARSTGKFVAEHVKGIYVYFSESPEEGKPL